MRLIVLLFMISLVNVAAAQEECTMVDNSPEPPGIHRNDAVTAGEVVLTFDDGPYVDKTPPVLDLLSKHDFNATFFVLGRHIGRRTYPLIQRMDREGHIIASHSYDHDIDMAKGFNVEKTVTYIRGQHEATRVLIEIALLARSETDFDVLYNRVFKTDQRLDADDMRDFAAFVARHHELLAERGYPQGRYEVVYSRPPGGGPYLGKAKAPRARYDAALEQLSMLNVMWHAQSGDIDATRARDYGFLASNLQRRARRGGVLLIHDFIRADALGKGMTGMVSDGTKVISLHEAMAHKYGCSAAQLGLI